MVFQLTNLFKNLYKSYKKGHMTKNEKIISQALQYENLSASAIANKSGLSQPTVSLALQNMPVIKIGGGRSSRFALVQPGHSHPLYQINTEGFISELGELYPLVRKTPSFRVRRMSKVLLSHLKKAIKFGQSFDTESQPLSRFDGLPSLTLWRPSHHHQVLVSPSHA